MDGPADLVREYLLSFAGGEPAAIAGFVAEEFCNEHLSALGSGCVGRAEYLRRLPEFLSSFTDICYTIDDVVEQAGGAARTEVVVRYRLTAVYSGHRVDIPGVMWFTVRDGLITRRTDSWDSLTFLQQTGQH